MAININHPFDKIIPSTESIKVSANGALKLPAGSTSARPVSAEAGFIRWNTTENRLEVFEVSAWNKVATGDGIVTSVTLSGDSNFVISNPTVTSAGTIDISLASSVLIETLEVTGTAKFHTLQVSSNVVSVIEAEGSALEFAVGEEIQFTLLSGNRAGFNTTSPTEVLEVTGTSKFQHVEITVDGQTYFLPTSAGTSAQVLTTNGDGSHLYWADNPSSIDFQNFDQDIIPDQDQVRSLGTSARQWKDVFVGPGSLYVNGKQVISDDSGTIVVSTDPDQNLSVKTTGTGDLELAAMGTGALTFKSDINIQSGFTFYSTSSEIDFGDDLNLNSNRIKNLAAPVSANDALRQVDLDTFDPTVNLGYTPLDKAGDQMSGNLDMQSNKVINLGEPTADSDGATKLYVDNVAAGLNWKDAVLVKDTSSSDTSPYTYVSANDDNTTATPLVWTGVSSNPTWDAVIIENGDRILITEAAEPKGNGVFTYDSAANGFRRASDSDNTPNNEVRGGNAVFVSEGSAFGDTGWILSTPDSTATLGTEDLVWTQFSGNVNVLAGDGINKSGNTISVDNTVARRNEDQTFDGHLDIITGGHIFDGDFDYGLKIESFQPAIALVDRSSGAGQSMILGTAGGGIQTLHEISNNDGTIGVSGGAWVYGTFTNGTQLRPILDNTMSLGDSSHVWSDFHTMEGTFHGGGSLTNPVIEFTNLDKTGKTGIYSVPSSNNGGNGDAIRLACNDGTAFFTFDETGFRTTVDIDGPSEFTVGNGQGEEINFKNSADQVTITTAGTERVSVTSVYFRPITDDDLNLGAPSWRWEAVYAVNGTIQTSDLNLKEGISDTTFGLDFINKLRPVEYRYKDNPEKKRLGLIAQEVKEHLPEEPLNIWSEEEGTQQLAYSEFVAPLIKAVQELNQKVEEQQATILALQEQIKDLK